MGKPDDDGLRKKYPAIYSEINDGNAVQIMSVRSDVEEGEKAAKGSDYPTAVDYIRLCKNDAEAREIIDYLEKRGEISSDYAKQLRDQLAKKGLRSFGKKRKPGVQESGEKV
ncbi:MAG: DUF2095 family protein [Candidatus Hadarchaeales archaeon]